MATFQALKVSSSTEQMPGIGDGQSLKCMASTYTYAAAPTAGDVINSALIQQGCVVTGVRVIQSVGATFSAGVVGTPAYHIAAGTTNGVQAINVANTPYVMPSNGNVIVTLSAGTQAGTVTIIVEFLPIYA